MAAMAALSTKIGTTYAEAGDQKLAGQSSLFAVARPQRMRPSTKPPGAEAAVDAISPGTWPAIVTDRVSRCVVNLLTANRSSRALPARSALRLCRY
jgi:hypothetical protein